MLQKQTAEVTVQYHGAEKSLVHFVLNLTFHWFHIFPSLEGKKKVKLQLQVVKRDQIQALIIQVFLAIITRIQQSRANKLLGPSCLTEDKKVVLPDPYSLQGPLTNIAGQIHHENGEKNQLDCIICERNNRKLL